MTSPGGSKGSSPLRVGALALLGVGAVAALLGVVALNSGSEVTPVAAPSLSTTASPPPPSSELAAPPVASAPPLATTAPEPAPAAPQSAAVQPPPAPAPAPAAPPIAAGGGAGGSSAAASGSGSAAQAARSPVRVYNNSRITGLAEEAAQEFRNAGWTVDAVDNYPSGIIPTSTVYYTPGTAEQSSAEQMRTEFGLRAEPRFAGLKDASPGLIVIVTRDYQQQR